MIHRDKDLATGIFFMVVSLLFVFYTVESYSVGSATNMGPGYFPLLVSSLILIFSLMLTVSRIVSRRSFQDSDTIIYQEWPALVRINLSILFFAVFLTYLGLILSTIGMIMISNHSDIAKTWKSNLTIAISISMIGYVLFVMFLGIYVPVAPRFLAWN